MIAPAGSVTVPLTSPVEVWPSAAGTKTVKTKSSNPIKVLVELIITSETSGMVRISPCQFPGCPVFCVRSFLKPSSNSPSLPGPFLGPSWDRTHPACEASVPQAFREPGSSTPPRPLSEPSVSVSASAPASRPRKVSFWSRRSLFPLRTLSRLLALVFLANQNVVLRRLAFAFDCNGRDRIVGSVRGQSRKSQPQMVLFDGHLFARRQQARGLDLCHQAAHRAQDSD